MKICPNCQTRYTDDTLQFCLQDGAALESDDNQSSQPTVAFDSEPETVVRNRPTDKIEFDLQNSKETRDWQQQQTSGTATFQTESKKSNTALAVVTTILAMLLIFGIGIGAWIYFSNKENEIAKNTSVNSAHPNSNAEKENINTNLIANPTATSSPTNSEKPSPKPTQISETEKEEIKKAVNKTIFNWKWSAEGRQLSDYMKNYADTVDYYNKKGASINTVRSDKEKAFTTFDTIKMNFSNVNIKLDDTGEIATAVFDKQWFFDSEEKASEGKVQSQLQLKKIDGAWKITGEKDLKVYYVK